MAHSHSHPVELIMVNRDEEHLKLLAIYHFVVAGFTMLALIGFVIIPLVLGPAALKLGVSAPVRETSEMQRQLLGGLLLGGLLSFVLAMNGWSLKKREYWVSCIILSCIECLSIPVGLILGVSAILVLRRDSVKALFKQQSNELKKS
jgi:hypothetical protein